MQVSPAKTSRTNAKCKYFDGRIGDGKKVVRVVGFDTLSWRDYGKKGGQFVSPTVLLKGRRGITKF